MTEKIRPYLLLIFLIGLDQTVKWWVLRHPLFVKINSEFIFGLGQNWDLFFWISCILIVILFLLSFRRPIMQIYSLFIILAAAISNLTDRIFRGGVVDYWRLQYFHTTLFFNLADVLLVIGVIIYVWQIRKEN